jgi:hypothetical protein
MLLTLILRHRLPVRLAQKAKLKILTDNVTAFGELPRQAEGTS